jgi:hypothetical protein
MQFYSFSSQIPALTSISKFTVTVTTTDGQAQTFDNNGSGYPISDQIFVQTTYSSLAAADASGNQQLTVYAAVRTAEVTGPVTLDVELITPMTYNNLPTVSIVPQAMTSACAGQYYTFYTSTFAVPAAGANSTKYGVSATANGAAVSDSFKSLNLLSTIAAASPSCNSSKRS